MKRKSRDFEIFSLSFLDIISCGFGAVVLLVLISPFSESVLPDFTSQTRNALDQVLQAEARIEGLERALEQETRELEQIHEQLTREQSKAAQAKNTLRAADAEAESVSENLAGLELVERSLRDSQRASIRPDTAQTRDEEVGGIPVDSDYVVFIIDTSGSMQSIWPRVTREVENIYIFGDDYTGSSYDSVIGTLKQANANRITGKPLARVHAIGFLSPTSNGRFETLMREVTRQNNGTFIALPVR